MDNKMTALNEMELENVDGGFGILTAIIVAMVLGGVGVGAAMIPN